MSNTIDKSLAPQKSRDITPQNTPVSANQESVENSLPKSLTAFIPNNLELDKLLRLIPPTFKYDKDDFLYLIDLMYKLASKQINDESFSFFIRPHSTLMQRRVRNYRKCLDYLVENKILIEDPQYIVNKKSRGFMFTNQYCTELKQTKITNQKLIKKILKFYKTETNQPILNNDGLDIFYLLKWFENGKLKIDYPKAKAYLKSLYYQENKSIAEEEQYKKGSKSTDYNFEQSQNIKAIMRYNSRLRPLILFNNSTFNPTVDKTAGRLHSVLTQLKSDLRQFITYNGEPLVAIDIVNSQPYLASVLLNEEKFKENKITKLIQLYNPKYISNNNTSTSFPIMLAKLIQRIETKNDTLKYIESVANGQFYEEFAKQMDNDNLNRKDIKKATFSSIFSPNQLAKQLDGVKLFKEVYPSVFKVFTKVKSGKGTHRTLACILQNFEANLILHIACKKISKLNPDIPLFTLHDSIITTPKYQTLVEHIMNETLSNGVGFPPVLKVERWEQVA